MSVVTVKRLLEHGVHFGHQTRRWDPKCKPYIYTSKGGIYILDLVKTQVKLEEAYVALREISEKGGKALFVGTKKQSQEIVMNEALRSGSFYVNQRWLGGILTNFNTINKRIKRLHEINELESSGAINVYHKKEIAMIRKQATRLENFLGGIKEMKKLPDALVVVDPKEEHNAIAEAKKLKIPVFGLIDTNCDPSMVDYPIPANDDAVKSITLIMKLLADSIIEAKAGILEEAFQNQLDGEDATMSDVIVNVERFFEESERRRKARDDRRPKHNRYNSERRFISKRNEPKNEESSNPSKLDVTKKEETKIETPKVETTVVEKIKVEETKEVTPVEKTIDKTIETKEEKPKKTTKKAEETLDDKPKKTTKKTEETLVDKPKKTVKNIDEKKEEKSIKKTTKKEKEETSND